LVPVWGGDAGAANAGGRADARRHLSYYESPGIGKKSGAGGGGATFHRVAGIFSRPRTR